MDVGKRIKEIREKSGMTQNGLADRAGISQTHLRRVELGQADITVGHLQLVCDALVLSLQDFFTTDKNDDELNLSASHLTPKQKALLVEFLKSIK